ncbi:hypothetical protein [Streptomyces wuyuanensis]|uniref:hypothetical protein n=1 Tax=Streptomyces wuyuanensis TaxID=1196353 RepID=UPI00341D7460
MTTNGFTFGRTRHPVQRTFRLDPAFHDAAEETEVVSELPVAAHCFRHSAQSCQCRECAAIALPPRGEPEQAGLIYDVRAAHCWQTAVANGLGCPVNAALVRCADTAMAQCRTVPWPEFLAAQHDLAEWEHSSGPHTKTLMMDYVHAVTGTPPAELMRMLIDTVWPAYYRTVGEHADFADLELYARGGIVALEDWGLTEQQVAHLYPDYLPYPQAVTAAAHAGQGRDGQLLTELISVGIPAERGYEQHRAALTRDRNEQPAYSLRQWGDVCLLDGHNYGIVLLWLHLGGAYCQIKRASVWTRINHDAVEVVSDRLTREGHNSFNIMIAAGAGRRCAATWYLSETLWALTSAYPAEFTSLVDATAQDEATPHPALGSIHRAVVWLEGVWHLAMGRYRIFQRAAAAWNASERFTTSTCQPGCMQCQLWLADQPILRPRARYCPDSGCLSDLPSVPCTMPPLCQSCTHTTADHSTTEQADYADLLRLWFYADPLCPQCRHSLAITLDAWGTHAGASYIATVRETTVQARLAGLLLVHDRSPMRLSLAYLWGRCAP